MKDALYSKRINFCHKSSHKKTLVFSDEGLKILSYIPTVWINQTVPVGHATGHQLPIPDK